VLVNPHAVDDVADAIFQAIEMPREERRKRMQKLRETIAENNVFRWAGKFLSTLLRFEFSEHPRPEFDMHAVHGRFLISAQRRDSPMYLTWIIHHHGMRRMSNSGYRRIAP